MDNDVTILIVDDKSTNILLLTELLKKLDIHILAALSGKEALEMVQKKDLALAILDIQMPEMNGFELAIELNSERSEQIPVIFVTAVHPENDQVLMGYQAGAVDFLVKPFNPEILVSKAKIFIQLFKQKQVISEIAKELSQMTESLFKANTSLSISKEEYETLMNASPDGVFLINRSGIVTEVSKSVLDLYLANDRRELVGKHFLRFIPVGQNRKIQRIQEQLQQEGLARNVELLLQKKDQSYFPCEISAAPIERKHNSTVSFLILVRDISYRKSIESQLIHSDRLASLGEMASGMAHEINQPLNTISLVLDNMILEASKSGNLNKDYFKKKSHKIFENIQRIKNLIDHVRIYSRKHSDFINESFDVNQSIQNALNLMNEQIRRQGIEVKIELSEHLPPYLGNKFELEQVIINLLSNAKDAILEKMEIQKNDLIPNLKIHSYCDDTNIYIEVTDTGIGIKSEYKDRIFLPFFSTKGTGKGTGLGLSISYTIIRKMNGILRFVSKEMEGTTFQIIFPIKTQN